MGLDFKNAISKSIEAKKSQQGENKVQRLEDRIKDLETLQENIQKSISGNITKVHYSELKIRDNIRTDIEPEMIESLAISILENGQLQPVLITSDRCLISGYRRYNALLLLNEPNERIAQKIIEHQKIVPKELIAYSLDKKYDEISPDEREVLQFIENDERKSLDNFEISEIFWNQKEKKVSQEEIAKRFNKSKGYVSSLLALKKIDRLLVKLIKEIQLYGCTKKKFNKASNEEKEVFQKNQGIVGWNFLYKIAIKDIEEQKKLVLNTYKKLMDTADLENSYFSELTKEHKPIEAKFSKAVKQTSELKKTFATLLKKASPEESKEVSKILEHIDKINEIMVFFDYKT